MDTPIFTYVDKKIPDKLKKLLKKAEIIAIDTEADSLHHYFHRVCLIQLNVSENIFIIDPLNTEDKQELFEYFKNKLIILHGGDYDIRILKRDFDFVPDKVFDTMLAMQILGYDKLGLSDLVEKHFHCILSKGPQKMDWSQRPLNETMLTYAANDVHYLLKLHQILKDELEEKNRLCWLEENCRHLIETSITEKDTDDHDNWRIKGSYTLSRPELAYLKELWKWREEEAKRANVPTFKIFKNEWLIELSRWCVKNSGSFNESPLYNLVSPWKERVQRIEKAIGKVKHLKYYNWPKVKKPAMGERKDVSPEIMDSLKKIREILSQELHMDPHVIINQKTLTSIASIKDPEIEAFPDNIGLSQWQKDILEKKFIEAIKEHLSKVKKSKKQQKFQTNTNHSNAQNNP